MTIVSGKAEARRPLQSGRSDVLRKMWEHRADYAYVLPAIAVMLVVIAYPIYYTIELSFFNTPPGLQLRDKIFVGFNNYTAILTSGVFWQVTFNTLIWTAASTFFSFVLGFAAALALHRGLDEQLVGLSGAQERHGNAKQVAGLGRIVARVAQATELRDDDAVERDLRLVAGGEGQPRIFDDAGDGLFFVGQILGG